MSEPVPGLGLDLQRIVRRFGAVSALAGLSARVAPAESVLLLGPNGAGKSTLLRIIAGLTRPTSGRVAFFGPAWADPRAAIGYLGHKTLLHDYLTARENLEFYSRLYGEPAAVTAGRVETLLQAVGLSAAAERTVRGFSRGMLQRLALARALIHQPQLLLLDEPATGLDAEGRARVLEILAEQKSRGVTLLQVSHDPEDVLPLVERVWVLERGELVEDAPAGSRAPADWRQRTARPAEVRR